MPLPEAKGSTNDACMTLRPDRKGRTEAEYANGNGEYWAIPEIDAAV